MDQSIAQGAHHLVGTCRSICTRPRKPSQQRIRREPIHCGSALFSQPAFYIGQCAAVVAVMRIGACGLLDVVLCPGEVFLHGQCIGIIKGLLGGLVKPWRRLSPSLLPTGVPAFEQSPLQDWTAGLVRCKATSLLVGKPFLTLIDHRSRAVKYGLVSVPGGLYFLT